MAEGPKVNFKYITRSEEPVDNEVGTLYFMDASAIYIGVKDKIPHCIFKGSSYMPYDSSAFLWRQGEGTDSVTQVLSVAKALGENSIIAANNAIEKTYAGTYTITDNNPSTGVYNITPDPTDDLEAGDIVKISIGGSTYFAKISRIMQFPVLEGSPTYRIYLDGFTTSTGNKSATLRKAADIAYGACSGFFGNGNVVAGTTSYVLGLDLTARNDGEFAVGVLNKSNATYQSNAGRTTRFSVGIGDYIENSGDSSVPRNALEIMQNGDIYVYGAGDYDGTTVANSSTLQDLLNEEAGQIGMISVTYDELVDLVDSSSLLPGMQYRITDYACTTTQAESRAVDNLFDIIVTADSSVCLNENARACHHDGDTYFESCKLEAWELKYCLDNDTSRFLWADSTNGKGVIYHMKDEHNNECPYDFKNIQFKRYAITYFTKNLALVVNNPKNGYGFYYGAKDDNGDNVISQATYGNDFDYFYTFAAIDSNSGNYFDYSVNGISGKTGLIFAQNDSIGIAILTDGTRILNNNVLFGGSYTNVNIKTGANCLNWTCGNGCSDWKCGDNCSNWVCANECSEWVCTGNCNSWTCGVRSHRWTCSNNCSDWKCGDNCSNWTCGSYSSLWICGNECSDWSCGVVCSAWTCGNSCSNWTCSNNCSGWTCGNECINWSCGNDCNFWNCNDKIQNFTIFNNVEYINIINTSNTNPQQPTCNFQILDGTKGASVNTRLSISFEADKNYTQIAGLNSSGVLKIWTPADLID